MADGGTKTGHAQKNWEDTTVTPAGTYWVLRQDNTAGEPCLQPATRVYRHTGEHAHLNVHVAYQVRSDRTTHGLVHPAMAPRD